MEFGDGNVLIFINRKEQFYSREARKENPFDNKVIKGGEKLRRLL